MGKVLRVAMTSEKTADGKLGRAASNPSKERESHAAPSNVQRRLALFVPLLAVVLIWWVWREKSLSALAAAILLFVAPGCWMSANDPTQPLHAKAGYTFSVLLILLAATIFLTGTSLILAAKTSSITAVSLLAIGLFSRRWAGRLKESRLRRLMRTIPDADHSKIVNTLLDERGTLVALEFLLDGEIRLVAVTLGFVSAIVWLVWAILRQP
jgi:hypothetical protein